PKSVDTIRQLVARHGKTRRSFLLICSFNARDTGVQGYLQFLDEIPEAIGSSWRNVADSCNADKKSQPPKLKLCFPFFSCQTGAAKGFEVLSRTTYVYHSSATMIHFCTEFYYRALGLPDLRHNRALVELANRPLYRLEVVIPKIELAPPQITQLGAKG